VDYLGQSLVQSAAGAGLGRAPGRPFATVGDVITVVAPSRSMRVVAIDDFPHAELVEHDVRAIFTIEPA